MYIYIFFLRLDCWNDFAKLGQRTTTYIFIKNHKDEGRKTMKGGEKKKEHF